MIETNQTVVVNDVLAEALRLGNLGYRVLPLYRLVDGVCNCHLGKECGKNSGKHPKLSSWETKATDNLDQIHDWFEDGYCNLGVLTGDRFIVVDGDGEAGKKSLAKLKAMLKELGIETVEVRSGSGAGHLYFSIPSSLPFDIRSSQKTFWGGEAGIDIKGHNGYVVAPPSNHLSGNVYEWVNPPYDDLEPAQLPGFVITEIIRVKDHKPTISKTLPEMENELGVKVNLNTQGTGTWGPKFKELFDVSETFTAAWGRVGTAKYTKDDSDREWVMVKEVLRHGFKPQEALDFLVISRGMDMECRPDTTKHVAFYYALTVYKAVKEVEEEKRQSKVGEQMLKGLGIAPEQTKNPTEVQSMGVKTMEFPTEILPSVVQNFICKLSNSYMVPHDFPGVHILAVLGAAIGKSHQMELKEGFTSYPNLFCTLLARPGTTKSPTLDSVIAPLTYIQQDLYNEYLDRKLAYEVELEDYEAHLKSKKKLTKREQDMPKPSAPILKPLEEIYTTDATMEAVLAVLNKNKRGLLLVEDEQSSSFNGENQYKGGRGNDGEKRLQLWTGASVKLNRKGDEPYMIIRPFYAQTGNMPPSVLMELAKITKKNTGLLDRFLISYPDFQTIPDFTGVVLPKSTSTAYSVLIRQLYELPLLEDPVVLRPVTEAYQYFENWTNNLRKIRREFTEDEPVGGVYSKMDFHVTKFALILEVAHNVAEGKQSTAISLTSMVNACKVGDYFLSHARKVYSHMAVSAEEGEVARVLAWIEKRGGAVTGRDIQRSLSKYKKQSAVAELCLLLIDHGVCKWDVANPGKLIMT